jgi:hypothetical protein
MTRARLADLPFWPRLLSREEAPRYLGVSVDVFDDEVKSGVWPRGTSRGARGGRLTWDRLGLDHAADGMSGAAPAPLPAAGYPQAIDETAAASAAWERRLSS